MTPNENDARRLAEAEREANVWQETARQHLNNEQYYRGLLVKIGEGMGAPAYTCDDGSMSQDVLVAKVPELVAAARAREATLVKERDEARARVRVLTSQWNDEKRRVFDSEVRELDLRADNARLRGVLAVSCPQEGIYWTRGMSLPLCAWCQRADGNHLVQCDWLKGREALAAPTPAAVEQWRAERELDKAAREALLALWKAETEFAAAEKFYNDERENTPEAVTAALQLRNAAHARRVHAYEIAILAGSALRAQRATTPGSEGA